MLLEKLDEELGDKCTAGAVAGLAGEGVEEEKVDLGGDRDGDVAFPVDCGDGIGWAASAAHGIILLGG